MKEEQRITCFFVDIGGVLLTDGWGRHSRKLAAKRFGLDGEEMEQRHNQVVSTFELGKLTLDDYLGWVVFYEERSFTPEHFREFMFSQTKPYPDMITLIGNLKSRYGLRVMAVSNESRQLNEYRIKTFSLNTLFDTFISSCYVHLSKPDPDIYRLALDIAQVSPGEVLYIENTRLFIRVAETSRIRGICHTSYPSTLEQLASYGFKPE